MKASFKKIAVSLLLATSVGSANAAVYQWSLDLGGSALGFLDFDTTTNNFRLYDNFADTGLASPTGINGLEFTFLNPVSLTTGNVNSFSSFYDTANGAVYEQFSLTGVGGGTLYTYTAADNQQTNEINDGESSSFNFGVLNVANIQTVRYRLNTNNSANLNNGGFQNATAVGQVPEAETSAMMVLGLAVLGLVSNRRRKV